VEGVAYAQVIIPGPLNCAAAGSRALLTLETPHHFVCSSYHQRDEVLDVIGDAFGTAVVNVDGSGF